MGLDDERDTLQNAIMQNFSGSDLEYPSERIVIALEEFIRAVVDDILDNRTKVRGTQ